MAKDDSTAPQAPITPGLQPAGHVGDDSAPTATTKPMSPPDRVLATTVEEEPVPHRPRGGGSGVLPSTDPTDPTSSVPSPTYLKGPLSTNIRDLAAIRRNFENLNDWGASQKHKSFGHSTQTTPNAGQANPEQQSVPPIEGFEIRGKCGRGGMGDVFRAFDKKLKVEVALKVPRLNSDDARQRFLNEARQLAQVEHRNVVGIRSWGESGEHVYFTMYLIAGPSAATLIEKYRSTAAQRLGGDDILRQSGVQRAGMSQELRTACRDRRPYYRMVALWMAEAAEGLAAAHRRGIYHRDIKPGNFLLAQDGHMMVADFGLAKTAEEVSTQTGTGVEGTYPYVAPERALGEWARVDHRADIWALGATLYEFLTYERAYPRNGKEVLRDIATKDPDAPRLKNPDVPAELESICLRAMARDPDRRFQKAEELAEKLREWARLERRRGAKYTISATICVAAIGLASTQPAVREFIEQLWPRPTPAAMSLEVRPGELNLVESNSIDLASAISLRLIRDDGTDETIALQQCELHTPVEIAALDRATLVAKKAGRGELTVRYENKSAVIHLVVTPMASPQGLVLVEPAIPSPAPQDEPLHLTPAQTVSTVRPLVLVALSEDLLLNDNQPARPGGEVDRYVRAKLADAGVAIRDVAEPLVWTEDAAIELAKKSGANVVVIGTATARRGAATRVSFQEDPFIDWTLNLTLEVIEVGGTGRRVKLQAPSVPRQFDHDASEYPGGAEDLRRLAQPVVLGSTSGGAQGLITTLDAWFPPDSSSASVAGGPSTQGPK